MPVPIHRFATLVAVATLLLAVAGCSAAHERPPTPARSLIPPATALDVSMFVGNWSQHAGHMVVDDIGSIDLQYQTHDGVAPPDFPQLRLRITTADKNAAAATVVTTDYDPVPAGSAFQLKTTPRAGIIALVEPSGYASNWCDDARFTQGDCGA